MCLFFFFFQLHKVNYEQENRIRKTEHLLQVAEVFFHYISSSSIFHVASWPLILRKHQEELMKAEVETDLISKGLSKVRMF